jgi:hypothetical protein
VSGQVSNESVELRWDDWPHSVDRLEPGKLVMRRSDISDAALWQTTRQSATLREIRLERGNRRRGLSGLTGC